jgi:hypothetical protein
MDEDSHFQGQATACDAGVTAIMIEAINRGLEPRAIAAGALMAVVRFHMDSLATAPTERAVIKVMTPAISYSVHELARGRVN